jgi:putative endonuclease
MEEVKYFIYILFSQKSGKYYVGHSNDPFRRVNEHNTIPFNTYTSKNRPWILAAVFSCPGEKSAAMKIEKFIKQQKSQHFIEKIVNSDFNLDGVLAQLVRVPHMRD